MKIVSYILAVLGLALFACAVVGRYIAGPVVFGAVYPLKAKTVLLVANSFFLMAILAAVYAGWGKKGD